MREGAWKVIQKRKHVVSRVYVFDAAANDLLLLGQVEQTLYNGKVYVGEWAARILVVYDTPGNEAPESEKRPKITYHKGWAVSGHLSLVKNCPFSLCLDQYSIFDGLMNHDLKTGLHWCKERDSGLVWVTNHKI